MSNFAIEELVENLKAGIETIPAEECTLLNKTLCNKISGMDDLDTDDLHMMSNEFCRKGNEKDAAVVILTALRKRFMAEKYNVPQMSIEGAISFLNANKL